jgi:hypothetical protein
LDRVSSYYAGKAESPVYQQIDGQIGRKVVEALCTLAEKNS